MRRALVRREPRILEEIERQPLIWNSHVTDSENRQLGERKHIDWATVASWYEAHLLGADLLDTLYDIRRGVQEIEDAIPQAWDQVLRGDFEL